MLHATGVVILAMHCFLEPQIDQGHQLLIPAPNCPPYQPLESRKIKGSHKDEGQAFLTPTSVMQSVRFPA